jgi:multisubunit Na+/H+ antiporter MnhE subunit
MPPPDKIIPPKAVQRLRADTFMKAKSALGTFLMMWGTFSALYLSQVSAWDVEELTAGAAGGALAAALLASIGRCSDAKFGLRWRWFLLLAQRLPGRALADCAVVFQALRRRRVSGEFRAVPFDIEHLKRTDSTRRALVIAGVSVAPNSLVITVDPKRDRLLVHQLVHTPNPPGDGDRLWPL